LTVSRLLLKPLSERVNDLDLSVMIYPDSPYEPMEDAGLDLLAERVCAARQAGAPVVLMLGAHVLRRGNSPLLIDLMEKASSLTFRAMERYPFTIPSWR